MVERLGSSGADEATIRRAGVLKLEVRATLLLASICVLDSL